MSKRTYVCFPCRTTERVPYERATRNCRKCHAPAEHVYYKFRIPRADDDRGWADLMQKVRDVNRVIKERALERLRSEAERYARIPDRNGKAAARLRDLQEKIQQLEQWR